MKVLNTLLVAALLCLQCWARENPFRHYVMPLKPELAEAILEVAEARNLRIDEVLQFGFVFLDENAVKIVKTEENAYLIEGTMTPTNALVMMGWIGRTQFPNGGSGKINKAEIAAKINLWLDEPMQKAIIETNRKLEKDLQEVRKRYR